MSIYSIEIGEDKSSSTCPCCDRKSYVGHGFIYKNNDAYAVYYVGWSQYHDSLRVSFALSISEWGDESTSDDRVCFGVEVTSTSIETQFRVLDPSESPWPNTDLLGKMLVRGDSVNHLKIREAYEILELVICKHIAIKNYLQL